MGQGMDGGMGGRWDEKMGVCLHGGMDGKINGSFGCLDERMSG